MYYERRSEWTSQVNIGKGLVKWKLDYWLQMNVVIHKILSFQMLGKFTMKNNW